MAGSKDGVQAAEKGQWLTVAERVSGRSWKVGARERGAAWPKVTVFSQGCREKQMHRKSRENSGNRAFECGIKPRHQNGMVAQPGAGAGGCGDPHADGVCLRAGRQAVGWAPAGYDRRSAGVTPHPIQLGKCQCFKNWRFL